MGYPCRQRRASRLRRVIAVPIVAALSLLPVTGTLVSSAGASQKPLTPLTIIHVRGFHAGLRVGNDRVCAAIMPSTSSDLGGCHVIRVGHSAAGGGPCTDRSRGRSTAFSSPTPATATRLWARQDRRLSLSHLNGARTWHRVVVQKGAAETLGLTTATNAIYAITGVCSSSDTTCGDYHIARSPLSANRWTGWKMPIGHSAKTGVWGFPYVPAGLRQRGNGSPSNLPAPPSSSTPAIAVDRFRSSLPPNWAV